MNERDTANRFLGYADALADCVKDKHITTEQALVFMGAYGMVLGEKGKRVEGVGPHTSPRASGGRACHWYQAECPGACPLAHAATHHATQPTQVHGNTALDTTSHG